MSEIPITSDLVVGTISWKEPDGLDCAIKGVGTSEENVRENLIAIAVEFGYDTAWPASLHTPLGSVKIGFESSEG